MYRARYTSPMPPAPSDDWISYGPSFFPGARAMRPVIITWAPPAKYLWVASVQADNDALCGKVKSEGVAEGKF